MIGAVGIDPSSSSSAGIVGLDASGELVFAASLKIKKTRCQLVVWNGSRVYEGQCHAWEASNRLRHYRKVVTGSTGYVLVAEGLFVRSRRGGMSLAEAKGRLTAPWHDHVAYYSPNASSWRASVLGSGSATAGDAVRACAGEGCNRAVGPLGPLQRNEHVCEAAMMAVYGRLRWEHEIK